MDRNEIERLRQTVSCSTLLERDGWTIDRRESSPRAIKFRKAARIIIVSHGGRGWFDPLSDQKGDVFTLLNLLSGATFAAALQEVAQTTGSHAHVPCLPLRPNCPTSVAHRWAARPPVRPLSTAFSYLHETRRLPRAIILHAARCGLLRQGPHGSSCFAHRSGGELVGWEERGETWRGFAWGGKKALFTIGDPDPHRICIAEAAIDALSLAAIEGMRSGTLYASTAGGWSALTAQTIEKLVSDGCLLVAAGDHDGQGDIYAQQIREIAEDHGLDYLRLRPKGQDWNEDLCSRGFPRHDG